MVDMIAFCYTECYYDDFLRHKLAQSAIQIGYSGLSDLEVVSCQLCLAYLRDKASQSREQYETYGFVESLSSMKYF